MSEQQVSQSQQMSPSTNIKDDEQKIIDHVTALQDTIDSFSLSLFEALRSLRDAVDPDSNNTNVIAVGNTPLSDTDGDYQDFRTSFGLGEVWTSNIVNYLKQQNIKSSSNPSADVLFPKTREQYAQVLTTIQQKEDAELVSQLASNVLKKSSAVDELVSKLPGMNRTKEEQLNRMDTLVRENWICAEEVNNAFKEAHGIRGQIRDLLDETTCDALGIEEEY